MKIICIRLNILIFSAMVLSGCFFGKAPISRFYLLDYVPSSQDLLKHKPYPLTLRIKSFTIAEAYERPEIVYRKSAHELRFYDFHRWAVKPEHLVSDMIFKHFRDSKLVRNIVKSVVDSKPDYVMTGQILAIEEYDNKETWYAHLAINFQLEDANTKELVWQHSYDVRKVVAQHEPVYVVRELSFLLENTMDKVVKELDNFFHEKYGPPVKSAKQKPASPARVPAAAIDTIPRDTAAANSSEK